MIYTAQEWLSKNEQSQECGYFANKLYWNGEYIETEKNQTEQKETRKDNFELRIYNSKAFHKPLS